MVGILYWNKFRTLRNTLAKQETEIAALLPMVQDAAEAIFEEMQELTGQEVLSDVDAGLSTLQARGELCRRLVFVNEPVSQFNWWRDNYASEHPGFADYTLAIRSPLTHSLQTYNTVCSQVLLYNDARWQVARWILHACDRMGCDETRRLILGQLETVLKGSPDDVLIQAYEKAVAMNQNMIDLYLYLLEAVRLMSQDLMSLEKMVELRSQVQKDLAYYYDKCCTMQAELSDFAWLVREEYAVDGNKGESMLIAPKQGLNAVTGETGTPPVGIKRLSKPTVRCGITPLEVGEWIANAQCDRGALRWVHTF